LAAPRGGAGRAHAPKPRVRRGPGARNTGGGESGTPRGRRRAAASRSPWLAPGGRAWRAQEAREGLGGAEIRTPRRYYARQAEAFLLEEELELATDVLAQKQALPVTPFPVGFPFSQELLSAGYEGLEDLLGADEAELAERGFSEKQVARILRAVAFLEGEVVRA